MVYLYLHGFNSDGDGWKAEALRRQFPRTKVNAPDLPASPREVVDWIANYVAATPEPVTFLGTSLGGFYAFYASALYRRPALLFNPSLFPDQTLDDRGIGEFLTWTKGRPYPFKREYLPELALLREKAFAKHDPRLLRFFLAEDDDVLDLQPIPKLFPTADVRWFSGAGHGFRKFEKVLKMGKAEGWLGGKETDR